MANKVQENRMRRFALRRGLVLHKSRRRDPGCPWHGKWVLVERWGVRVIACIRGRGFSLVERGDGGAEQTAAWLTLAEVERVLIELSPVPIIDREGRDARLAV